MCRVSMQVRCRVWPGSSEFNDVVLHCFTFSRSTVVADAAHIKPEVAQLIVQSSCSFSVIRYDTRE